MKISRNNGALCLILTLVLFSWANLVMSFRTVGPESTSMHGAVARMKTELMAWSIPTPDMSPLTSLTSAWYQECHPTARKTVYDDVFVDYTYTTESLFDNDNFWTSDRGMELPSTMTTTSTTTSNSLDVATPANGRRNPLRRAVGWARRRISSGQMN